MANMKTRTKFFAGTAIVAAALLFIGIHEAVADGFPAMAPSPDSDCGGASLSPTLATPYSIGDTTFGRGYAPLLFFRTQAQAQACRGSSDYKIRTLRNGHWI